MEVRMVCRLGMVVVLGGVLLAASSARAFSMGEVTATTGMQGSLARSGTTSAAGTIGTVKRSLAASTATKQAQLDGAAGTQVAWGGKGGGPGGWAKAGSGTGWAGAGGAGGWTTASSGWATGSSSGGAGWASGSWGTGGGR